MHLHEYQAKTLFTRYGIPVPQGLPAFSLTDVAHAASELGGNTWVLKAQVHAGGRGKAGGVKKVHGREALERAADALLGTRLVTPQTGPQGKPVERLLVEQPCDVQRELYVACLVDRASERVALIASAEGGMDIEEVAQRTPEAIHKVIVNPLVGLQAYQSRQLAFALNLSETAAAAFVRLLPRLYALFTECDLNLLEINPLVVTAQGELLALDAKVNVDDNALYRQAGLAELRDPAQEDPKEHRAQEFGLNYIALEGDIGCMVNGAGLAMATMDLIKLHGGSPANFLDVGGGTSADKVAQAFKLILSDANVKAVLVNIFGGIVRCDLIAEGIINAVREVDLRVPVIVRLIGTNAEQGRALLGNSGLAITAVEDLAEAAKTAVTAARGRQ